MMPPMVLKLSKREEMAAAVAATTMDVIMTILIFAQHRHICIGVFNYSR